MSTRRVDTSDELDAQLRLVKLVMAGERLPVGDVTFGELRASGVLDFYEQLCESRAMLGLEPYPDVEDV